MREGGGLSCRKKTGDEHVRDAASPRPGDQSDMVIRGRRAESDMGLFGLVVEVDGGVGF